MRADTARWHLQERQKVYTDFMRAAVATGATLSGITNTFEELDLDSAAEKLQACRDRTSDLTGACALVLLQGPREVANKALTLDDNFSELLNLGKQWKKAIIADDQEKIESVAPKFRDALEAVNDQGTEFARSAHAVLVKEESSLETPETGATARPGRLWAAHARRRLRRQ
ncbi:hypothetical protein [Streptomyces sp. NPDC096311]|uniref:hypothetical protein n=1 Tax=Streptomyces sp. NPDC096311 TaxID=3366083 RepID=UPI003806DC67